MNWEKIFEIGLRPLVMVVLFICGIYEWNRQKGIEQQLEKDKLDYQKKLDKDRMDYQKELDKSHQALERDISRVQIANQNKDQALKAIWALMRYFSKIPSEDTVLYTVGKDYFFRKSQAQPFILAVDKTFYTDGHGLYLPSSIKKPLFKIRDSVDKLNWDNRDKKGNEDFKIDQETGKAIYQQRNEINNYLRESV